MAITIERDFAPGSRYQYDFGACTVEKGWAQLDTRQDASYYGNWINPAKRRIFTYCEGDLILTKCETDEEFRSEVLRIKTWHDEAGYPFLGIDPGFSESLKSALVAIGLQEYLHSDLRFRGAHGGSGD